jgi:hypothetical protein
VAPNNDLILDLESVTVNEERYAVNVDADRFEAKRDDSLVSAILGAAGIQVRSDARPQNGIGTLHGFDAYCPRC